MESAAQGPENTDANADAPDASADAPDADPNGVDADDADEFDEDFDDDLEDSYIAVCPISDATADLLIAAARLDLRKAEEADRALVALGFLKDGIEIDGAWYRTPAGHLVYGDFTMAVPFAYSYGVGGELHPEDYWGTMPGWTSQASPESGTFAGHLEAVVQTFTRRLGRPPESDGRTREPFRSRMAAWRVEGNLLIIGEGKEPYSYWQDDQALVFITAAPEGTDAELPEADGLEPLIRY